MAVDALDGILGDPRRGPGCRVCGAAPSATVKVLLSRIYLGSDKKNSASKARTLCSEHAVELYERLVREMEGAVT